ncbi:MAG: helix-turn-helix transcriptional regulator [Clostridia bacterium]|nr:helix-turn-helix transcriptional regulator [Clostridia bacterium]
MDFMNLNKAFALRLKNLLLEKKISKYKLEKETGLTHSALRYIFNEVNVDVKFSTIVKVCNALDISLSDFFNDKIFDLNNLDVD